MIFSAAATSKFVFFDNRISMSRRAAMFGIFGCGSLVLATSQTGIRLVICLLVLSPRLIVLFGSAMTGFLQAQLQLCPAITSIGPILFDCAPGAIRRCYLPSNSFGIAYPLNSCPLVKCPPDLDAMIFPITTFPPTTSLVATGPPSNQASNLIANNTAPVINVNSGNIYHGVLPKGMFHKFLSGIRRWTFWRKVGVCSCFY